jgi:hypothetical protein
MKSSCQAFRVLIRPFDLFAPMGQNRSLPFSNRGVETTDLQCSRTGSRRMSRVHSGQFDALLHEGLAFALELVA